MEVGWCGQGQGGGSEGHRACDRAGVWGMGQTQGLGAGTQAKGWWGTCSRDGGHMAGVWDIRPGAGNVGRGASCTPAGSCSHSVPQPPTEPTLGTRDTPKLSWGRPYRQHCPLPADAPWCRHCQQLAPAFAQAAATLRNESSPARLGKVDATAQVALASEFDITSYPTLKLFRDGNRTHPLDYTGMAAAPAAAVAPIEGDATMGAGVGWRAKTGGRG